MQRGLKQALYVLVKMKFLLPTIIFLFSCSTKELQTKKQFTQSGLEVNSESTFLNGEYNSKINGQMIAISGKITLILPQKNNHPLYKLKIPRDDVGAVWITIMGPKPKGGYKVGDNIIVSGYLSQLEKLDAKLREKLKSEFLLLGLVSAYI
jgi:hypothetical protein